MQRLRDSSSAHIISQPREDCTMLKLCEQDSNLLKEFKWNFWDKKIHAFWILKVIAQLFSKKKKKLVLI